MKLDVGCGVDFLGDVNCDLYISDVHNHRVHGMSISDVPNFICCDARFLPFRNNIFEEVICRQVIEHLPNPVLLLKELVRVSNRKIVVETVHRFGEMFSLFGRKWKRGHHISNFNMKWFVQVAPLVGCVVVRKYVISWMGFPFDYFSLLRFPHEIGVVLLKSR